MSTERLPIEEHPDIARLKGRYERVGESMALQFGTGVTILAGLFVALSPWIVGFGAQTALSVNNLVVGLAVAVLALGLASTFRATHGQTWIVPLLGVWTIIAPWVMAGTTATLRVILSNVIGGAVVLVLGLAVLAVEMRQRRAS